MSKFKDDYFSKIESFELYIEPEDGFEDVDYKGYSLDIKNDINNKTNQTEQQSSFVTNSLNAQIKQAINSTSPNLNDTPSPSTNYKSLFNRIFQAPSKGFVSTEEAFFNKGIEIADETSSECEFSAFFRYYPVYNEMSNSQLNWYIYWRTQLRKDNFIQTDLSYYYVYIYEIINLIGISSPETGLEQLTYLFNQTKEVNVQLEKNIILFIKDFIIYYDIKINYFDYIFQLDNNLAARYLWLENITNMLENKQFGSLIVSFGENSRYNLSSSHFLKNGYYDFFNQCLEYVFTFLNKNALNKHGGIIRKYWNQNQDSSYVPFLSGIFYDQKKCAINGTNVINSHVYYHSSNGTIFTNIPYGWHNSERWLKFVTSTLKYTEYRLRQFTNYKFQIKTPEINIGIQKLIDKATEDFFNNYLNDLKDKEKRTFLVDTDALKTAQLETHAINNKLITELYSEEHNVDFGVNSNDKLSEESEDLTFKDSCDISSDEILFNYEVDILNVLLKNNNVAENLNNIADKNNVFTLVLLDSINEKLYDIFNDNIIDTCNDPPEIYNEYMLDLQNYITSRYS